jgi:DNA-directed RNA polymerase sigma subunit (sigma70/sigma32)
MARPKLRARNFGLGVGEERSRQIEREALHRLHSIAAPLARAA